MAEYLRHHYTYQRRMPVETRSPELMVTIDDKPAPYYTISVPCKYFVQLGQNIWDKTWFWGVFKKIIIIWRKKYFYLTFMRRCSRVHVDGSIHFMGCIHKQVEVIPYHHSHQMFWHRVINVISCSLVAQHKIDRSIQVTSLLAVAMSIHLTAISIDNRLRNSVQYLQLHRRKV